MLQLDTDGGVKSGSRRNDSSKVDTNIRINQCWGSDRDFVVCTGIYIVYYRILGNRPVCCKVIYDVHTAKMVRLMCKKTNLFTSKDKIWSGLVWP